MLDSQNLADDLDLMPVQVFCRRNGIGRTSFYAEVQAKRLKARKVRGRTVVAKEDAAAWRASLPTLETAAA